MTKKDEAFALFEEGKTALSPEVKALKLKSQSRYNYYYEWQKTKGGITPSSAPSGEAKGKSREAKGKDRVEETRILR